MVWEEHCTQCRVQSSALDFHCTQCSVLWGQRTTKCSVHALSRALEIGPKDWKSGPWAGGPDSLAFKANERPPADLPKTGFFASESRQVVATSRHARAPTNALAASLCTMAPKRAADAAPAAAAKKPNGGGGRGQGKKPSAVNAASVRCFKVYYNF